MPCNTFAHAPSCLDSSISGAPPPAIKNLLFTKHLTTHRASCKLRSASSITSWLDPRTSTVAVRPISLMPVILTIFPSPIEASSTSSAYPNFSARKCSIFAIGRQLRVFVMNSMSSRSTSLITKILALAR
uniref:Uncharacterized protein n=1 Tax=Cucumis sativus TaxID=3659 RepID=A0A0A0LTR0_CUCSA